MELIEKQQIRPMRKECSRLGWALVIYYAIMYAAVLLAELSNIILDTYLQTAYGTDFTGGDSWGYFLAIFIGLVLLLVWKKPKFFVESICKQGRGMHIDDFMQILLLFIGVQGVQYIATLITELSLNSAGYTMTEGLQAVSGQTNDIIMFLYVGVGAPIAEELLFRGLVIRPLERYGKRFAIIVSALLFGLFHGNLIQAPYAALVGLILGYVAVEYSIGWAIVLHMFNNMIFADTITRLIPGLGGNLLLIGLMLGCMIAGIVILIVRRRDIRAYRRYYLNQRFCWRAVLSAPGVIVFTLLLFAMTALTMFSLITPLG